MRHLSIHGLWFWRSGEAMNRVTYDSIVAAKRRILRFVQQTPLIEVRPGLFLKLENTHPSVHGFKVRGAANAILQLKSAREVVTAAMGTHGFAVGFVCRQFGIRSTCFMPRMAAEEKKTKMAAMVDSVTIEGDFFSATEQRAVGYARTRFLPFIHPYNDLNVISGQGTIGLEIAAELLKNRAGQIVDEPLTVYVQVGGGGLISGVAVSLKHLIPSARIIGVQPFSMHAMKEAVDRGRITAVGQATSLAESLCVNLSKNAMTFPLVQKYVDAFVLVTEEEIRAAMRFMHDCYAMRVEGAGAASLAAALANCHDGVSVAIISGANVSEVQFNRIMRSSSQ